MAYSVDICHHWNMPRQGFDKCVSVCMSVQSRNSLSQRIHQALAHSTEIMTNVYQSAFVTATLTCTAYFGCSWDIKRSPIVNCELSNRHNGPGTVNSRSEY